MKSKILKKLKYLNLNVLEENAEVNKEQEICISDTNKPRASV